MRKLLDTFTTFFKSKTGHWVLIGSVLLISTGFRLFFLSYGNILGDEPLYSIRSIGLLDTLGSPIQTTPLDWFETLPWWAHLSFHDHPPLVFWIHHLFFEILGSSLLAQRLPSALFGIASVILSYFLGKKLYDKKFGLAMMLMMAINNFAIFYSRVVMMESITLFFILLGFYFFVKSTEDNKWLPWWGLCVGISVLSKYVGFFLLPAYFLYIILYKRNWLKDVRFYIAIGLGILVFSPVIIYNIQMYRSVGHFDLQFAFLLQQDFSMHWQELPGKTQRGSLLVRLQGIGGMLYTYSPLFFFFALCGFMTPILKKSIKEHVSHVDWLFFFVTVSMVGFMFLVGSGTRFLSYTTPFLIYLIIRFYQYFCSSFRWLTPLCIIFLLFECFFSYNTILASGESAVGLPFLMYPTQLTIEDSGDTALDKHLNHELRGYTSKKLPQVENKSIMKVIEQFHQPSKNERNVMLVFDPRINITTLNYVFLKRTFYEGWPITYTEQVPHIFQSETEIPGDLTLYYVHALPPSNRDDEYSTNGLHPDELLSILLQLDTPRQPVYNRHGHLTYWVFELAPRHIQKMISQIHAYAASSKATPR